jgi:hypothetical protein
MSDENGETWTRERMRRRFTSIIEVIEGRPRSEDVFANRLLSTIREDLVELRDRLDQIK